MIKRILITVTSLIVIFGLYWAYCDYFWENYRSTHSINETYRDSDLKKVYKFNPSPSIPKADTLSLENFQDYKWRRELIEPYHLLWINEVELSFPTDSSIVESVTAHDIDENYWSYPIFRKFRPNEPTYEYTSDFDKKSMSFVERSDSIRVKILLEGNHIIIEHVFL